ncbi:MAG TPA: cytochrome c oxidase accessory protein CcoG [Rhodocyclaceae bacterium]|nr:cytochrome c oxidase accessory protein CcoG [Rhodocyclaceae bacterium]
MSAPANDKKVIEIHEVQGLYKSEPKVYPRTITGLFTSWRWAFVWLTQAVFYGLCWLPWNGRQAVLFDLDARRFYLFDLVLWPQDTIYLAVLLILSALALFLFTTVAGRLWCGYACPQTVYTEIFLWIEKMIEGERPQRMKLDASPWSARKVRIKVAKNTAWIAFSLWTGITFVGYFTPIRDLVGEMATLSLTGWESFWVLFYGAATYGNAGFLREQMCKYICPYARFQSVMFDRDTLIITYDAKRGDPRGARSKKVDPKSAGLGDCVDCGICVQVCPTGIDIRNGLQNECIGCAACIDACDQVMDKVGYSRGLIRYSTENALQENLGRKEILRRALRPRTQIYAAVFLAVAIGTGWSLGTRKPLKLDILRDRAALAREADDGAIENTFQLQISNASERAKTFSVKVGGIAGLRLEQNVDIDIPAAATSSVTVQVKADPGSAPTGANPITFTVGDRNDASVSVTEKAKFWMP